MPDKDPYVCGCNSEDYEFFCEKNKPCIGEPIINLKPKSIIDIIIMIPVAFCIGLICLSVVIGPILIELCVIMVGLCAAAIGALAAGLGWIKFKTAFYCKYCLWRVKGWWWRKKQNFSK